MREKLMTALGDFADTATHWRRLGHNVPVPGAHDLISANMQPVPDLPPETAKMRAASITIEFNKLTKERADLIKRFSS
jgi:hypothetical protein